MTRAQIVLPLSFKADILSSLHSLEAECCEKNRYIYWQILIGHWRMSHYFVKEMFTQVLVSPTLQDNSVKVSIVSENLQPLEVELTVKVQRWDQLEEFHVEKPMTISLEPQSVTEKTIEMAGLLHQGRCFESNETFTTRFNYCFLTFE